jgi:RTX calcium-binding nonapeptide repeat (4 copies)
VKLGLTVSALAALALAVGSRAAISHDYPDAGSAVWLSDSLVRFETNLGSTVPTDYEPYVVRPDGSGLRPATATEATAEPASDTAVSPDGTLRVLGQLVGWFYARGHTLYVAPVDGSAQPVRVTPTSCTLGSSTHSALTGRCIDGTDGADRIVGTGGGDVIIGASGDDAIRAGDGENVVEAQWGDDDIRSGSGADQIDGGAGNDVIRSGAGSDKIVPGAGGDTVFAGAGVDYVAANDGRRDVIDCGPGDDRVVADRRDVLRHCEHVFVRRPGPPNFTIA